MPAPRRARVATMKKNAGLDKSIFFIFASQTFILAISWPSQPAAPASGLRVELDLDVGGRNCDRAVERSPAFEGRDQLRALLRRDAFELRSEEHTSELQSR